MKRKLLLITCIGILGASAYGNDFTPKRNALNFKAGITGGKVKLSGDLGSYMGDQDTSSNISLNLEYIATSTSGLEYGLGLGFSKIRPNEDQDMMYILGDVDTFPMYGLLRYKFDTQSNWNPYVFANLGYAYANEKFVNKEEDSDPSPDADVDGGLYYAFGIGVEYNEKLSAEFFWSRSELDVDVEGVSGNDFDADLLTLAVGYRFDMSL